MLHAGRRREVEIIGMGALATAETWNRLIEQTGHDVIDCLGSHLTVVFTVQYGTGVKINLGQNHVVFQQFFPLGVGPIGVAGVAEKAAVFGVIERAAGHIVQRFYEHGPVEIFSGGPG